MGLTTVYPKNIYTNIDKAKAKEIDTWVSC